MDKLFISSVGKWSSNQTILPLFPCNKTQKIATDKDFLVKLSETDHQPRALV